MNNETNPAPDWGPIQEIEDLCETVDAAVFSGGILYSEGRAKLKGYVDRWARAIAEAEASVESPL